MSRTLDLAALRGFVTVADSGGVTAAAAALSLTQSAVSMQVKRLEEALGQPLFDRSGRGMRLTALGEQLLGYARRMLDLNDEALTRLTDGAWEGELTLGVPHDIVYPHAPAVLNRFARSHPRVRVRLLSSYTRRLKAQFAKGEVDIVLTTEDETPEGAETLETSPLVWVGAPGGQAWRERPLKLAFEYGCIFRPMATAALDAAGIGWTMAVEADSTRTVEATVSADLAAHVAVASTLPPHLEPIAHGGALPPLPTVRINMYVGPGRRPALTERLAEAVRAAWRRPSARPAALLATGS
jgi:DNA-binding transcriptional LysR family regulator